VVETMIGLFKSGLMKPRGPWRTVEQVEIATLEYVDWFNPPPPVPGLQRHPTR
jgi:putative transposase